MAVEQKEPLDILGKALLVDSDPVKIKECFFLTRRSRSTRRCYLGDAAGF